MPTHEGLVNRLNLLSGGEAEKSDDAATALRYQ